MYISAVNPLILRNDFQIKSSKNSSSFSPKVCDEVSFCSNVFGKFQKTLYRAIGKSELDELLKPDGFIYGQKYTTGNPMGWGARDWASGFKHGQSDHYFVEFKPNNFDYTQIMDASDYNADSRFVITGGYSLNDVRVIREGTNSHGKIIWADSVDVKIEDASKKATSIFHLLKQITSTKNPEVLDDAIVELSSYTKEFPQVITALLPRAVADKDFAYKLTYLIAKADDESYVDFIRGYYKDFLKNPEDMKIHEMSLHYIAKHGSNEDLDLILSVMQKDKDIMYHTYGVPVYALSEEKDIPKLLDLIKTSTPRVQNGILNGFMCGTDDKLTSDIVRGILNQYSGLEASVVKRDNDLKSLLATCVECMFKCGEKRDIPLFKKFTNLGIYTDVDFKALIKALEE
ncbi:hypothetical protein J6A34_03710 [bacterium]|nr:hypothetical protein [bacterium]